MANYAYVENGVIQELHDLLPANWKNVSGLKLSENDTEFLKSIGWYPIVKQYQTYNKDNFKIVGYNHQFSNNDVVETLVLDAIPAQEVESFVDRKNNFLYKLRAERNIRLQQTDFSQLSDVQNMLTEEQKLLYSNYRQNLRDLPSVYSNNDVTELSSVNWPVLGI